MVVCVPLLAWLSETMIEPALPPSPPAELPLPMPSRLPPPCEPPPLPPDRSLSLITAPELPETTSPPACWLLSSISLPRPTATCEPDPARMSPLLTSLLLPSTAPSPLTMSPLLSPSTTTPPLVAVLVLLSPRVMSPKPRLKAPFWAFAPASWFGLAIGTLLWLARSVLVFGAKVFCGAQEVWGENGEAKLEASWW
ncbi:hypothetical protein EB72_16405 [Mycobacterium sp. SWH-M1]|nr:hypothetical protein EB72_16405 [Mycobacterium sp. SWH-M1]